MSIKERIHSKYIRLLKHKFNMFQLSYFLSDIKHKLTLWINLTWLTISNVYFFMKKEKVIQRMEYYDV